MTIVPATALHSLASSLTGTPTAAEVAIHDSPPSDLARLMCGIAAGDEAAFREFHGRYFDRLYQFLLVVARGQETEAQEALQETLLRVVRHARAFDTEEALWDWLKVVARSAARDGGRKRHRYLALLSRFTLAHPPPAIEPDRPSDDGLSALLEECLAELDPDDRRLIEGKYLDEEPVKALSAQTGLTDRAVESRLLRLRRRLRERLLQKLRTL